MGSSSIVTLLIPIISLLRSPTIVTLLIPLFPWDPLPLFLAGAHCFLGTLFRCFLADSHYFLGTLFRCFLADSIIPLRSSSIVLLLVPLFPCPLPLFSCWCHYFLVGIPYRYSPDDSSIFLLRSSTIVFFYFFRCSSIFFCSLCSGFSYFYLLQKTNLAIHQEMTPAVIAPLLRFHRIRQWQAASICSYHSLALYRHLYSSFLHSLVLASCYFDIRL